jgi:tetratricopeptide (TPR) repeat protein
MPAPNGALVRRLGLPLDDVPPGAYEMIVVATDRVAGQAAASREPFVVEDAGTLAAGDVLPLPCRPETRGVSARYWAIVDIYARGDVSRAVEELGGLPDSGVREEVARLGDLAARAAGCTQCPDQQVLSRRPVAVAAMLHSDAGWGVFATSHRRSQELSLARDVLDALRSLPGGSGFARRWFLASILRGHQRMDWETAERVATEGLKRFPDDPELLLAQGTLLETLGWRATADAQAGRPYLERAEAALARAQELAGSDEGTLRLAHVRWRLGRTSVARASLGRLAAQTRENRWRYLAFLFLGGVLEQEGALSEAARAYRHAVETQPDTQAGRMALAHCLVRLGDVGVARATVADALALTRPRDPFWRYPWGRSEEGDGTLVALRAEAPGCCH